MTPRQPVCTAVFVLALSFCSTACGGHPNPNTVGAQLQFGVDMARRGLWQEALFRFHQAERLDPANPRVYNNLAVAYEANGQFDKALEYYQKALRAAPDSREARGNYARFVEFYQAFKPKPGTPEGTAPAPAAPAEAPPPESLDPVPSTPPAAPPHIPAATPEARPQEPEDEPPPAPPPPPPPAPRNA
jgi:tetratricopeptide (TPR) repeat protein